MFLQNAQNLTTPHLQCSYPAWANIISSLEWGSCLSAPAALPLPPLWSVLSNHWDTFRNTGQSRPRLCPKPAVISPLSPYKSRSPHSGLRGTRESPPPLSTLTSPPAMLGPSLFLTTPDISPSGPAFPMMVSLPGTFYILLPNFLNSLLCRPTLTTPPCWLAQLLRLWSTFPFFLWHFSPFSMLHTLIFIISIIYFLSLF